VFGNSKGRIGAGLEDAVARSHVAGRFFVGNSLVTGTPDIAGIMIGINDNLQGQTFPDPGVPVGRGSNLSTYAKVLAEKVIDPAIAVGLVPLHRLQTAYQNLNSVVLINGLLVQSCAERGSNEACKW
jgi:hypothetical protein